MSSFVDCLEGDERAVADSGYRGHPEFFDTPWKHLDNDQQRRRKALARARHETVNRRFKKWEALHGIWRHPLQKHGVAFHAVANIEQVLIEKKRNVFQVEYNDRIGNEFDY
ncbi:hypothetical protein SEMRO_893_G217090.1 [Seminavis robusta]|nr:hypothetical protein SEMRO_893_G217090.1 [Seminavis robusta]|eukprot:Sro893_g217090.1 n/a (111) ;mRNA; f:43311-43643